MSWVKWKFVSIQSLEYTDETGRPPVPEAGFSHVCDVKPACSKPLAYRKASLAPASTAPSRSDGKPNTAGSHFVVYFIPPTATPVCPSRAGQLLSKHFLQTRKLRTRENRREAQLHCSLDTGLQIQPGSAIPLLCPVVP